MLGVVSAPDPRPALDAAGLEHWEAPASLVDGSERSGVNDPRGVGAMRISEFPGGFTRPASYPEGWPFLPDLHAAYAEVSAGGEELRMMLWPAPPDVDAARATICAELGAAGWEASKSPDSAPDASIHRWQRLATFERTTDWRALSLGHDGGVAVLALAEARRAQVGGDQSGPSARAV